MQPLVSQPWRSTRLGAIYTLERISQESEREYWPIMETLTAYVREHAHWQPLTDYSPSPVTKLPPLRMRVLEPQHRPNADIQAILTVLGRRDETRRQQDEAEKRSLDLRATDLRGAKLKEAHLKGAILLGAHLECALLAESAPARCPTRGSAPGRFQPRGSVPGRGRKWR